MSGRPGSMSGPGPGQMGYPIAGAPTRHIPPGWAPSLSATQQQNLLGQALSFSKAQSARTTVGQPTPSPAHLLMQLGYVYVKAAVLPNNGQGAGIPGNGASGAGAVLSIDEARMIGILPQPGQPQQQGMGMTAHQQTPSSLPGQTAPSMMMQPQTPQNPHSMAPPPVQTMQSNSNYRASPSSIPVGAGPLPPSSPSVNANSPAKKVASMPRARQSSVASRPDSSHGRASVGDGAHQQNAFGNNFVQPPMMNPVMQQQQQQQQQPMPMGGIPNQAPLRPSSSAGHLPSTQIQSQSQGGPPLPPVNGGTLPKKTKAGFDVAEYNTRLTPLPPSHILTPEATHSALEDLWKPLTEKEGDELQDIMKRDGEYTKRINGQAQRNNAILMKRIQDVRPVGWMHWWERGLDEDQSHLGKDGPFENFKILLPADKRTMRASQGVRSALFPNMSTKDVTLERKSASKFEEDLVPVRIEIEHEGWILRDTFTWPAPESYKSEMIERFAVTLCEDFGLPTVHFVPSIRETILSQVSDHTAAEAIRPLKSKRKREEAMGKGRLQEGEVKWWKRWRKQVEATCEQDHGRIIELHGNDEDDNNVMKDTESGGVDQDQEIELRETEAEMRIQIKLDITVGAMNLVDQFEWDISDEGSCAESFASIFAADLGLSGEFKTAIAHSIREQVDVYIRSLALVGYSFDGKEVLDDELREPLLSTIAGINRNQQEIDFYTPKLMQLSELEILHSEKEREKESRRKRRQTRGRRGVNLPDREPLKTARTPAVFGLQQSNNQGYDATNGGSELFGSSMGGGRSGAALTGIGGGRGGAGISTRRAAAAAANANIISHNSNSNDFGTPTPAPEGPTIMANGRKMASKRRKMESQAIHFDFPGGLGRSGDGENRGPRFAPSLGPERLGDDRSAELGNAPAKGSHHHHHQAQHSQLPHSAHNSITTPSTPVAWNMAKPEEAINQHPNWHEGQWYCSNCGVPGMLDSSRRKGPLGDKTLCGICGKYFHRHRKARPVEYTRDVVHHRRELAARGIRSDALLVEDGLISQSQTHSATDSPVTAPASVPAAVNTATSTTTSTPPPPTSLPIPHIASDSSNIVDPSVTDPSGDAVAMEDTNDPATRTASLAAPLKVEANISFPNTRGNSPDLPFEQVGSPDDSESSETSRPPSPVKESTSEAPRSVSPAKQFSITPLSSSLLNQQALGSPVPVTLQASTNLSSSSIPQPTPPDWLLQACHNLRTRYPLDRFEVQLRPRNAAVPAPQVPEWRIRCTDCPGKLYTPGPEESLTNFEIHLKNRAHRAAVQKATQTEGRRPYGS